MLTLAASGLCLAVLKSQRGNIIGSVITFYLIGTAWLAGRRNGRTGILDWAALFFGLVCAGGIITLGLSSVLYPAGADPNAPAPMAFFFGAILILSTVGDVRMLARGGLTGRPRIVRHLWRMCFGLFIATGSFFLGQQQVFPVFLRGSPLLVVLAVFPFPLMLYWLIRIRFSKAYSTRLRPNPKAVTP